MTLPTRYGPVIGQAKDLPGSNMYGRSNDMKYSLRLAEVIRVDYENMTCDLAYVQGDSPNAEEVPISAAYWSRRTFLGVMPEEGALAVVGFSASFKNRHTRPFILTFLPNGYETALNFDPLGSAPRNAEDISGIDPARLPGELSGTYGPTRYKFRKLYPGEVLAMSRQGAELILGTGVQLLDRAGSGFELREEDGSSILTSTTSLSATSAGRSYFGRVIRNALNLPTDFFPDGGSVFPQDHPLFEDLVNGGILMEDGSLVPDINSLPAQILPSGLRNSPITLNGIDPNDPSAQFFSEHRVELSEFGGSGRPSNPGEGFDPTRLNAENPAPFITSVKGTVVGNDPYTAQGRRLYGKPLRPVIFDAPSSSKGNARLEALENTEEELASSTAAANYYEMRRPDGLGSLFFAHDKEGRVYFSVPASTSKAGNLGAGRSLDGDFKGSIKLAIGANNRDNESLDISAAGGFKWNLGTASRTRRSLNIVASGGIKFKTTASDANGDGAVFEIKGNHKTTVQGNMGLLVSNGDHLEETSGKREMKSESLSFQVGSGDHNVNVVSDQNINVQGEQTATFGKGRSATILTGGESTDVLQGNSDLSFAAPAKRQISFALAGTHDIRATGSLTVNRQSAALARYTFQAPTGSYSVNLGMGQISMNAGAGALTITPASATLRAPAVTLSGSVALGNATAPNAVIGGVPGPSPHTDYVTGLPLTGNPLVRTL